MTRRLAVLIACASLGGCGFGISGSGTTQPSNIDRAQTTHEYPSPAPPQQTATAAHPTPIAAIHSFASQYINWQTDTVAMRMRSLAAQSVGQARSAMQLAAADTVQDYELRRGGVANSGTVEAIAPLAGHRNQYVVVTREQTTATSTPTRASGPPGTSRWPRSPS